MMDFKELSKFFHKNGYVYIKDFFNPNLMDECLISKKILLINMTFLS